MFYYFRHVQVRCYGFLLDKVQRSVYVTTEIYKSNVASWNLFFACMYILANYIYMYICVCTYVCLNISKIYTRISTYPWYNPHIQHMQLIRADESVKCGKCVQCFFSLLILACVALRISTTWLIIYIFCC